MSEKISTLLPNLKEEGHDNKARRHMSSHLPPFSMPSGPRNFSPATAGFDGNKPDPSHSMMSKFSPNTGANSGVPTSSSGQAPHDYNPQNPSGGPQYNMNNNMNYWPANGQHSSQVPFPNQQNPSHLPSVYGNMSQNYNYPPRPTSSNPMPRSGSPHSESQGAPLPPPQQMQHGEFNAPQQAQQQQTQQQQGQQQQPGGGNAGGYPMYVPQYGGNNAPQGPANIYGGPASGYGGGYPQPYGGSNNPQYGGMYSNQMPHSREGSQDTSQWQRSPYGPAPTYNGPYGGQYAPAPMAQQQVAYGGGRAGRGASNTGERPFKCDQCPQSFQRSHDLKRHKRIHLAIKPFPCPSCDKSFSRKDALKRHILVKGCGNTSS